MKEMNEQPVFEQKEKSALGRVEIYIVRHGRQEEWSDPHSDLGEEGAKQAEEFALKFLESLDPNQETVIKVKRSGVHRAAKTGDIIAATLAREAKARGWVNIKLLSTREDKNLKTTGSLGPVIKSGVPHERVVDEWLANAESYEGAKTPKEVVGQVEEIIADADALSKRMPEAGPKIIYIMVTHETSHAALMNRLTGKTLEDMGGGIGHLEAMKVTTSRTADPTLSFRGQEYKLSLDKKEKEA